VRPGSSAGDHPAELSFNEDKNSNSGAALNFFFLFGSSQKVKKANKNRWR
jgi:hypothetical protein